MLCRLIALLALAACATGSSQVRDPEGRPLPTTARLDADMDPATVWCGEQRYLIVEPPPPYLSGRHMATHEVRITDAVALCAKIRAAD
jgi:hypothetical protein